MLNFKFFHTEVLCPRHNPTRSLGVLLSRERAPYIDLGDLGTHCRCSNSLHRTKPNVLYLYLLFKRIIFIFVVVFCTFKRLFYRKKCRENILHAIGCLSVIQGLSSSCFVYGNGPFKVLLSLYVTIESSKTFPFFCFVTKIITIK